MQQALSNNPVAAFATPPHAPKPVAAARARFDEVATKWAAARGELEDAEQAAAQAKADATRAAADAYAAGKEPPDVAASEREHAEKIASLKSQIAALSIAVHETGNALAVAIGEHRDAWREAFGPIVSNAEKRYDEAIEAAQAALAELKVARGAARWLAEFDASQAQIGNQAQFNTRGQLLVRERKPGLYRGEHDPAVLLGLAAKATEPQQVKTPSWRAVARTA